MSQGLNRVSSDTQCNLKLSSFTYDPLYIFHTYRWFLVENSLTFWTAYLLHVDGTCSRTSKVAQVLTNRVTHLANPTVWLCMLTTWQGW